MSMSPLTTPPHAYIAFIICGMIVVKGGETLLGFSDIYVE